jgi:hypothetical protein
MPAQDLIGYRMMSERVTMRAAAGREGITAKMLFKLAVWQQSARQ